MWSTLGNKPKAFACSKSSIYCRNWVLSPNRLIYLAICLNNMGSIALLIFSAAVMISESDKVGFKFLFCDEQEFKNPFTDS
jgi:hypothetical protein